MTGPEVIAIQSRLNEVLADNTMSDPELLTVVAGFFAIWAHALSIDHDQFISIADRAFNHYQEALFSACPNLH